MLKTVFLSEPHVRRWCSKKEVSGGKLIQRTQFGRNLTHYLHLFTTLSLLANGPQVPQYEHIPNDPITYTNLITNTYLVS